jgi:hypothetical protein
VSVARSSWHSLRSAPPPLKQNIGYVLQPPPLNSCPLPRAEWAESMDGQVPSAMDEAMLMQARDVSLPSWWPVFLFRRRRRALLRCALTRLPQMMMGAAMMGGGGMRGGRAGGG